MKFKNTIFSNKDYCTLLPNGYIPAWSSQGMEKMPNQIMNVDHEPVQDLDYDGRITTVDAERVNVQVNCY